MTAVATKNLVMRFTSLVRRLGLLPINPGFGENIQDRHPAAGMRCSSGVVVIAAWRYYGDRIGMLGCAAKEHAHPSASIS